MVFKWFGGKRYGEPVVVVSGLPRSGTSMMMRMLEAGGIPIMTDELREADRDNPNGYYEYERVKHLEKETDKSYLQQARGKAIKVISFLIKDLPGDNRYKVIFMRRDLDEILASQTKMIARLQSNDTEASGEAMKEAFRNDIVRTRLFCKKMPNFELMEMSYRATIEDPEQCAMKVSEFLGGGHDVRAMAAAVDPALYRNRAS